MSFANKVPRPLRLLDVDSRTVMSSFCEDQVPNIPPAYLRPGFAFGGPEPTGYWLSDLPADTPIAELVRLAKIRWRVEHDYRELKTGRAWTISKAGHSPAGTATSPLSSSPRPSSPCSEPTQKIVMGPAGRFRGMRMAVRMWPADVGWTWLCETVQKIDAGALTLGGRRRPPRHRKISDDPVAVLRGHLPRRQPERLQRPLQQPGVVVDRHPAEPASPPRGHERVHALGLVLPRSAATGPRETAPPSTTRSRAETTGTPSSHLNNSGTA